MTSLSLRSRLLLAAAAPLLAVLYVVPLWRIQLLAPQYPEGLGMLIRLNTITGIKPPDLDNINGLNHYIGMKEIDPAAIPVLHVMPWVVGALAVFALIAAVAGRRSIGWAWLVSFAAAGAAGLVEFYRWSYDYGHNLAADAIIKVPGMTYQPPLIGSKQLLNFTATSLPAIGSWLAAAAFLLGVAALVPFPRRKRAAAVAMLTLAASCGGGEPKPIAYGRADCHVCRMRITDNRFGGEAVSRTGKVQQFDSIECLAQYVASAKDVRSAWVSDFQNPGSLLPAATARFIQRAGPSSGMGADLLALGAHADTAAVRVRYGAPAMSWAEVQALAKRGA